MAVALATRLGVRFVTPGHTVLRTVGLRTETHWQVTVPTSVLPRAASTGESLVKGRAKARSSVGRQGPG